MKRRIHWLKFGVWLCVLLFAAGGALWGVSYVMLRRTPEWYQPDTSTDDEKSQAARAFENLLTSLYDWSGKQHAVAHRAHLAAQTAAAVQSSTREAQALLAEKPDEAFQISFTDTQLNAFFNKWADTHDRRAWFEKYVEDPRLVLREKQLIVAGKIKDSGLIVSLVFEPHLDADGALNLNLVQVLAGVLPVPDAMWAGQRRSIEDTLKWKLPPYQQGARITSEGIANGDAGSAAMNELLLATLHGKTASAVIFVPLDARLSQDLPVKITALAIHDHTIQMTAEQMSEEERAEFLEELKGQEKESPVSSVP